MGKRITNLFVFAPALCFIGLVRLCLGETPAPSIPSSPPALPETSGLASLAERLANARSVKVQTAVLGVAPGDDLDEAHRKLDKLADRAHPAKAEDEDEESEGETKVLWQLAGTEYSAVFVKADKQERITYIVGILRPGRQKGFEKIGEVKKAPVQAANVIAWDVVRPNRPHLRVVAKGSGRKAETLTIFIVERPGTDRTARGGALNGRRF